MTRIDFLAILIYALAVSFIVGYVTAKALEALS